MCGGCGFSGSRPRNSRLQLDFRTSEQPIQDFMDSRIIGLDLDTLSDYSSPWGREYTPEDLAGIIKKQVLSTTTDILDEPKLLERARGGSAIGTVYLKQHWVEGTYFEDVVGGWLVDVLPIAEFGKAIVGKMGIDTLLDTEHPLPEGAPVGIYIRHLNDFDEYPSIRFEGMDRRFLYDLWQTVNERGLNVQAIGGLAKTAQSHELFKKLGITSEEKAYFRHSKELHYIRELQHTNVSIGGARCELNMFCSDSDHPSEALRYLQESV